MDRPFILFYQLQRLNNWRFALTPHLISVDPVFVIRTRFVFHMDTENPRAIFIHKIARIQTRGNIVVSDIEIEHVDRREL